MKYIQKRAVALLLILAALLATVGCTADDGYVRTGISIESDSPIKEESKIAAEQAALELLEYGYSKLYTDKMTDQIQQRLKGYAKSISQIIAQNLESNEQYNAAIDILLSLGKGVVDEAAEGESLKYTKARELYLALSSVIGADRVGAIAYDVCLMKYDADYELALERYEKYGYAYLLEDAEAIMSERRIFAEGITATAFASVIKNGFAISEMMLGVDSVMLDTLSDTELLTVIRHLDLSDIELDAPCWALLFSYVVPDRISEDSSYTERLLKAAEENGDIERISAVMTALVDLTEAIKDKLTAEDVRALRSKDMETLANLVFSRFGEDEWKLLLTVTSARLDSDCYTAIANEQYGAEWINALDSVEQVSFEELREAVGSDSFYTKLTGHLAYVCPVLYYEVTK